MAILSPACVLFSFVEAFPHALGETVAKSLAETLSFERISMAYIRLLCAIFVPGSQTLELNLPSPPPG